MSAAAARWRGDVARQQAPGGDEQPPTIRTMPNEHVPAHRHAGQHEMHVPAHQEHRDVEQHARPSPPRSRARTPRWPGDRRGCCRRRRSCGACGVRRKGGLPMGAGQAEWERVRAAAGQVANSTSRMPLDLPPPRPAPAGAAPFAAAGTRNGPARNRKTAPAGNATIIFPAAGRFLLRRRHKLVMYLHDDAVIIGT